MSALRCHYPLSVRPSPRQQWSQCITHLQEALAIQPLVPASWYLQGLAAMHIEVA